MINAKYIDSWGFFQTNNSKYPCYWRIPPIVCVVVCKLIEWTFFRWKPLIPLSEPITTTYAIWKSRVPECTWLQVTNNQLLFPFKNLIFLFFSPFIEIRSPQRICPYFQYLKKLRNISNWNNLMSCFISSIRPLPLPSPRERVMEPGVEKVIFKWWMRVCGKIIVASCKAWNTDTSNSQFYYGTITSRN